MDSSNSQGHDPGIPRRVMSRIFTLNRWYFLSLVLFALGLMAKPMLVTLPFVLLLLDWWPLGRLAAAGVPPTRRDWRAGGVLVAEKIPFLLLAGGSAAITWVAQNRGGAMHALEPYPFPVRLENALWSVLAYLGKLFWPAHLAILYPHPGEKLTGIMVAAAALLLLAVSAGALAGGRRFPFLATGWFWYLGMLVPVIGLVQVGMQGMADRYTYLPSIGLGVAVVWGLAAMARRRPGLAWSMAVGVLAVILILGVASVRQIRWWRGDEPLFSRALAVTEGNWLAHNNLGKMVFDRGRIAEAGEHFETALRLRPGYASARYNLGNVRYAQGRYAEAANFFEQAIWLRPGYVEACNNLGNARFQLGDLEGALAAYRLGLAARPDFPELHNNIGVMLYRLGRPGEAVPFFRQAVELKPDYPEAHYNLGLTDELAGRTDEAVAAYRRALGYKPDYDRAREALEALVGEGGQRP